jgi:endogenous inhibitor of DNA gyrase (YacG/DUF329 family)
MTAASSGSARGRCPICGRPSEPAYRPFCSRRCADVDLSHWLSGTYVIPDRGEGEERSADGEKGSDPSPP